MNHMKNYFSSVKMGILRMNLTKRKNNEKLPEIPEPQ